MKLDDVFERKPDDSCYDRFVVQLEDAMNDYRIWLFVKALVTDIDPDTQVKPMQFNRINALEQYIEKRKPLNLKQKPDRIRIVA